MIRIPNDMIDNIALDVLVSHLAATSSATGDVVEMGCNNGKTSLALWTWMREYQPGRQLRCYDAFELMPRELPGVPFARLCFFKSLFEAAGVPLPAVYPGLFGEDTPMPEEVSFALVDCDEGGAVAAALRLVIPRLTAGGHILVHDYSQEPWRDGVRAAVAKEWGAGTVPEEYGFAVLVK